MGGIVWSIHRYGSTGSDLNFLFGDNTPAILCCAFQYKKRIPQHSLTERNCRSASSEVERETPMSPWRSTGAISLRCRGDALARF